MSTPTLIDSPRLSINEVAARLGLHVSTVWRWCIKGCRGRSLPSITFGGRRYVLVSELEQFLNKGRSGDGLTEGETFAKFEQLASLDDALLGDVLRQT